MTLKDNNFFPLMACLYYICRTVQLILTEYFSSYVFFCKTLSNAHKTIGYHDHAYDGRTTFRVALFARRNLPVIYWVKGLKLFNLSL